MTNITFIDETTDIDALLKPYNSDESETHYICYNSDLQNGMRCYYDALDKSFKGSMVFGSPYTHKKAKNIMKRLSKIWGDNLYLVEIE